MKAEEGESGYKKYQRVLLDKITHRKDIRDEKNEPRLKFVERYESKEICTYGLDVSLL